MKLTSNFKKREGFTLIEMFVVIAVIGILAGIVLQGTSGFQSKARDKRRIGDLKNTQNYLELYYNKCGHYPGAADCINASNPSNWSELVSALGGSGITNAKIPTDPVPSKNYYYSVNSTDRLEYILGATLENDNKILNDGLKASTPTGFSPSIDCTYDVSTKKFNYCFRS